MQTKYVINLWRIRLLKIDSKESLKYSVYNVYFLTLPFLHIEKFGNNVWNVNLLIFSKIIDLYNSWQKKLIKKKFQKGKVLKICLLLARPGMNVFHYLYPILKSDKRFDVSFVVMPEHAYGENVTKKYVIETSKELNENGYNYITGYNVDTQKVYDLKKELNPDIIFYTDFDERHFYKPFYIDRFRNIITFLNDYGYSVMNDNLTCTYRLNSLVDIYFRPTDIHKHMCEKYMTNGGSNVRIIGSPKLDGIYDEPSKPNIKQNNKKCIIWAPHHSNDNPDHWYQYNGFYELYDYMFLMADKYKDKVHFVFRPHPLLKPKLYNTWGIERTDNYYRKWENLENGELSSGEFIELFRNSDAMIMDSCSFIAEYTAFNKPIFHTITSTTRMDLNDFGKEIYQFLYKPDLNLKREIDLFIENVVLNGNDYLKEIRTEFIKKYFSKINGLTSSENIYKNIVAYLNEEEI